MARAVTKKRHVARRHVVGGEKFAAISAVEGLTLTRASKKRLAAIRSGNLSTDEARALILHAYKEPIRR